MEYCDYMFCYAGSQGHYRPMESRASGSVKLILGGRKLGNLTSKNIKANICKNDYTCACSKLSF